MGQATSLGRWENLHQSLLCQYHTLVQSLDRSRVDTFGATFSETFEILNMYAHESGGYFVPAMQIMNLMTLCDPDGHIVMKDLLKTISSFVRKPGMPTTAIDLDASDGYGHEDLRTRILKALGLKDNRRTK